MIRLFPLAFCWSVYPSNYDCNWGFSINRLKIVVSQNQSGCFQRVVQKTYGVKQKSSDWISCRHQFLIPFSLETVFKNQNMSLKMVTGLFVLSNLNQSETWAASLTSTRTHEFLQKVVSVQTFSSTSMLRLSVCRHGSVELIQKKKRDGLGQ